MPDAQAEPTLHELWIESCARFEAEQAAKHQAVAAVNAVASTDAIGRALRHDGWTPERQQRFLRLIGEGVTVQKACAAVGLSVASAYAFRARAAGAAFALGWSAANLLAREPLADCLLTRALDGQVEWITRADGERIERLRYDNALATRMLARLDRQAAAEGPAAQAAARLVAGEFEAFVDLLGRDQGPARAGLFLAARADDGDLAPVQALARADRFARAGGGLAGEVATADLDLAARGGWTAEQWQRAEASGLLRLAPEPPDDEPQDTQLVEPVWWDEEAEDWRTSFPPPDDFLGDEQGDYGHESYARELAGDERALIEDGEDEARAAAAIERDRYFAALRTSREAGGEVDGEPDRPVFDWPAPEAGAASEPHVVTELTEKPPAPPPAGEGGIGLT